MSTLPITSLCSINPETLNGETPPNSRFRYLDISAVNTGLIDWATTTTWKYADAPSRARRVLRKGDALLCTVRPGLQSHALITTDLKESLVGSTGFAVLRPHQTEDASFVFHSLFSNGVAAQLRARETGSSYPAVSERDVRALQIFCPPPADRTRIATVLNTADEAIAKVEAVIAKLRQVRIGLIHDLLTCGLDENAHLRDPIAHPAQFQDTRLGQSPVVWRITPLSHLCSHIGSGVTPKGGQDVYKSTGILFIRSQNVAFDGLLLDDVAFITPETHVSMLRSEIFAHDVLYNITGASIGRCCPMPEGLGVANVNQHVCALRLHSASAGDAKFLATFLASTICKRQLDALLTVGNRQGLNYQQLGSFIVPWPDASERERISEQLWAIDSSVGRAEYELAKLRLVKSGLIDELLTSRVREPLA